MTDRREHILARLLEILKTEVGFGEAAVRNRGELPTEKRPAVTLLDGDEVAREGVQQQRGRLTAAPNLVDMTPEITVVLDSREPHNTRIGEDLNAWRIKIMKAVINDTALISILGGNGDIQYGGCDTDLGSGRSMEGIMSLRFTFTYALRPSEL